MIEDLHKHLLSLSPIHFIGVLGSGMRPLAELCNSFGAKVSGSDINLAPSISSIDSDITFLSGSHGLKHALMAKTVVYSSAISRDHPEILSARSRGVILLHRSELLALVSSYFKLIAVAGSHGKTTTTCLLAHVLSEAKMDPSFVSGASFKTKSGVKPAFHAGKSDTFLIEADESDGSFLRYRPSMSIVTNIGLDHLDFYKDAPEIENAFSDFVANTRSNGSVITHISNKLIFQDKLSHLTTLVTFGFEASSDLYVHSIERRSSSTRALFQWKGDEFEVETSLIGKFNCLNLAACAAIFFQLGGTKKVLVEAFSSFSSVHRRQDLIFERANCLYFDDYAHNPDKVRECVLAFREWFEKANLIVVFQPHRFSRFKALFTSFQSSFIGADHVVVTPVYGAGETDSGSVDFDQFIHGANGQSRCKAVQAESLESAADMVVSRMSSESTNVVLAVGAGDITKLAGMLEARL